MSWFSKTVKKVGKHIKKVIKHPEKLITDPITLPFEPLVDTIDTVGQWAQDIKDHPEHVADRQNQRELEAWNMQNEYNTPANQIARLKEAGLNPNLAYSLVNSGNAGSAPDLTSTGDWQGDLIKTGTGILGHAFNAIQLLNSIQQSKASTAMALEQAQHSRDVLNFQKHQADVNNAFRQQEMAYRQSHSQREYDNWLKEFEERVRHNKAMEGRPTNMSLLDNAIRGMTGGKSASDVATMAGNLERRWIKSALGPLNPKYLGKAGYGLVSLYSKLKY